MHGYAISSPCEPDSSGEKEVKGSDDQDLVQSKLKSCPQNKSWKSPAIITNIYNNSGVDMGLFILLIFAPSIDYYMNIR